MEQSTKKSSLYNQDPKDRDPRERKTRREDYAQNKRDAQSVQKRKTRWITSKIEVEIMEISSFKYQETR